MLPSRTRPVESTVFGFQNDVMLASYVPKKNRAVILLSSFHHDDEVVHQNKQKPRIVLDYNKYKSGVDTLDQVVRCYNCRRKSNRWPFLLFCNMLDIAAYNAFILFLHVHPNYQIGASHRRRNFLIELAKSMLPSQSPPVVRTLPPVPSHTVGAIRPGRCQSCPRTRDKKTTHACGVCVASVSAKNTCMCDVVRISENFRFLKIAS